MRKYQQIDIYIYQYLLPLVLEKMFKVSYFSIQGKPAMPPGVKFFSTDQIYLMSSDT